MSVSNNSSKTNDNQDAQGNSDKLKAVSRSQFEKDPNLIGSMWDVEDGTIWLPPPPTRPSSPQNPGDKFSAFLAELTDRRLYKTRYLAEELSKVPESINLLPGSMADIKAALVSIADEISDLSGNTDQQNILREQTNTLLEQILSEIHNRPTEPGTMLESPPTDKSLPPGKARRTAPPPQSLQNLRKVVKGD